LTFPLCSWTTLLEIAVYNAERASVMWAEVKQGLGKKMWVSGFFFRF
jgi:hypothetical protein